MTTTSRPVTTATTDLVVRMVNARLQTVEKTLDLAVAEPGQKPNLILIASTDLDVTRDLLTDNLQHLTEWQVSAFHDQYAALRNRLFQQANL